MGVIASQITSLTIVFSSVYLGTDQRKHQSSASLASVQGIHRRPVNSPHKWPVTRRMFPFDDVIMASHVSQKKWIELTSDKAQQNKTEQEPMHILSYHFKAETKCHYLNQWCKVGHWLSIRWALHFPGNHQQMILHVLTHGGRMTHIRVSKLTTIGSDNGLSPNQHQAIIWTNADLLSMGSWRTNFSEIFIKLIHYHSRKCIWKCRLENGGYFASASMC